MKYWKNLLPILLLALLLCSCRSRTATSVQPELPEETPAVQPAVSVTSAVPTPQSTQEPEPQATPEPTLEPTPEPTPIPTPEPTPEPTQEPPVDPYAPTQQDEASERREYAPDASGELTPGAEDVIQAPTQNPDVTEVPAGTDGAGTPVEGENGELTATETVPTEEADQTGVDDSGAVADSMQTYYLTLLSDRVGDLFECKRLYVYWETPEDHRTVFKTSQEHDLILGAGAYDVSAKLLAENLTVDDGWVVRKNPEVIVKVTGSGALDTFAAASLCEELTARAEWNGINAVQNRRVLVLSQSLLDTQAGRIAVMVYLAKLMYPEQLADVDAGEALRALTEESDGVAWAGQYAYMM